MAAGVRRGRCWRFPEGTVGVNGSSNNQAGVLGTSNFFDGRDRLQRPGRCQQRPLRSGVYGD